MQPPLLMSTLPPHLGLAGLLLLVAPGCARPPGVVSARPVPAPAPKEQEHSYSDEDAAQELGFSTVPGARVRSRQRSKQHRSMPLHGASQRPCGFDDCSISDEDDPLR